MRACYRSPAAQRFFADARRDSGEMATTFIAHLRSAMQEGEAAVGDGGGGATASMYLAPAPATRRPSFVGVAMREDEMAGLLHALAHRLAQDPLLDPANAALASGSPSLFPPARALGWSLPRAALCRARLHLGVGSI